MQKRQETAELQRILSSGSDGLSFSVDQIDDYTVCIHGKQDDLFRQVMQVLVNSGLAVERVECCENTLDASMSWIQFYKNAPMALIVCCLLLGNTLTGEVQRGTLIPVLTKGLSRWKIPLLKAFNLCLVWSVGY